VDLDGCPLPEDRLYDLENNVWMQVEPGSAVARIGIIAAFAAFIGPVTAVTYRAIDGAIAAGRSVGMLETVRYTGAVRMPVDGTVVERNGGLLQRPRLVNDSPYDTGWIARIRPERLDGPPLESAGAIRERLLERIHAQRIRCWPATPDLQMYEIGLECSAILTQLNEELSTRPAGTAILLVTDDPTSPIEMERWSDQTGHALLARRREGNLHQFLVRKEEHPVPRALRRG
jgi:glycine cleavage system H protein